MSLQAIADVAYDRRNPAKPTMIAHRKALESALVDDDGQTAQKATAKQFNGALEALKRYIPTELLALYLPFLAIAKDRGAQVSDISIGLYLAFVVASPLAVYLIYLAKAVESGMSGAWKTPPIFEGLLATIAFAVWGASVPSMFAGQQWWIGMLAMASAFVLPLLDTAFGKKLAKA